ncbi:hypothetical protein [Maricaulis sp.]|uniref:hypothetical protein n=1 Tax=Maricaulis sp. TaxID=1486257 RepID=UPI002632CC97|nr:hypothetical protein [Maricaulis sp.]
MTEAELPPLLPTIHFIIPVHDDDPEHASLTQGFAPSLLANSNLVRLASRFPSDIFERTPEGQNAYLAVRMGGAASVNWYPQSPRAIKSMVTPPFAPFTVLLLGHGHDADDYKDWIKGHTFSIAVVAEQGGVINYDEFTIEALQTHFLKICDELAGQVSSAELANAHNAIASWEPLPPRDLGYQLKGHNSVVPNLMALTAAGFDDMVSGRFEIPKPSAGNAPYLDQIVRSAMSIQEERRRIGEREAHRAWRCPPDVNLYAPAVFPHFFSLSPPGEVFAPQGRAAFKTVQRMLQRQAGYNFELTEAKANALGSFDRPDREKAFARHILETRALECRLGTDCVGALAASEISAVLRLPNDVNRTSGQVRQFAAHHRGANTNERRRHKAFRQMQHRITKSVPKELMEVVRQSESGVRIIADAHLEWCELDGLPLALAKDTSRIPVTPGNLFVEQIGPKGPLHLTPSAFSEILIISALRRDDPIQPYFEHAFSIFGKLWRDKISIRQVEVSSEEELVEALNNYQGALVIFDGHGSHAEGDAAVLHLMDTPVDVWHLQQKLQRPPPIVVLSACDTHAADRNHATTGNGFLSLRSRAVLSSVFPLHAMHAASFAARLVYRITDFLPAAFKSYKRSLTWLEFVSGMLRMQALTDFLQLLQRRRLISEPQYRDIGLYGNQAINSLQPAPFDLIIDQAAQMIGQDEAAIRKLFNISLACSSAISYVHLGRPETILIHPESEDANDEPLTATP